MFKNRVEEEWVLKELTELGIIKNISGDVIIEGDSKKLIFKF